MSKHEKLRGSITISRPHGSHGPEYAQIEVNDDLSGSRVLSARISLEEFAEALLGRAHAVCEFDLYPDLVGKKREHKEEFVPLKDGYFCSDAMRPVIAAEALAPFEVDGWKGRIDDLFNQHRRGPNGSRVTFVRYVEAQA